MTTSQELAQKRLAELEEAFELFNQTSSQLTFAYESLQNQVEDLKAQLAETHREKQRVGERLEQLLNLLPAGVIVLDVDQNIIDMNPAAEKILSKEAMGRTWEVVVKNVFLAQNDAGTLVTHDQKAYQLSESPLTSSKDQPDSSMLGKILLIQDITDARNLQQHVDRHQRLNSMGEMAASLAHQIRTPLSSALLYVSQLASDELDQSKRDKFVDKSVKSLRHLESLIKDMLQYAKGGRTHTEKVLVSDLLDSLKQSMEPRLEQTRSRLVVNEKIPGLVVLGDTDALLTALQNLVTNAMDVIVEEAEIELEVSQPNTTESDMVDIKVIDNGPGIDKKLMQKIFEPFYTNRAQGTGLGLAVVRAVAEAHEGEAWVESTPGRGATFAIRLPVVNTEEVA